MRQLERRQLVLLDPRQLVNDERDMTSERRITTLLRLSAVGKAACELAALRQLSAEHLRA